MKCGQNSSVPQFCPQVYLIFLCVLSCFARDKKAFRNWELGLRRGGEASETVEWGVPSLFRPLAYFGFEKKIPREPLDPLNPWTFLSPGFLPTFQPLLSSDSWLLSSVFCLFFCGLWWEITAFDLILVKYEEIISNRDKLYEKQNHLGFRKREWRFRIERQILSGH